jgi:hypothetical protein
MLYRDARLYCLFEACTFVAGALDPSSTLALMLLEVIRRRPQSDPGVTDAAGTNGNFARLKLRQACCVNR